MRGLLVLIMISLVGYVFMLVYMFQMKLEILTDHEYIGTNDNQELVFNAYNSQAHAVGGGVRPCLRAYYKSLDESQPTLWNVDDYAVISISRCTDDWNHTAKKKCYTIIIKKTQ